MSEHFPARFVGDTPHGGSVMSFYLPKGAARPPRVARGEGIYLYDERGMQYLDATSGRRRQQPRPFESARRRGAMIETGTACHVRLSALLREREQQNTMRILADRLTGLAGEGFDRAFFVSGGSEVNESALKLLARQYAVARGEPTRYKVISRDPSYHGSTMGAMAVTGDSFTESIYGPMYKGNAENPRADDLSGLPPGVSSTDYTATCAQALEAKILEEGPQTVLAFIIEPIGGVSRAVRSCRRRRITARFGEICDRHGVLLSSSMKS